jgi:SnoaL-like domain
MRTGTSTSALPSGPTQISRVALADGPSPGTWTGRDEAAQAWRDFMDAWEEYRVEVEDYRELDDERVFVLTRRSGRGKTSGLELGQIRPEGAALFHVRAGKVTRVVF